MQVHILLLNIDTKAFYHVTLLNICIGYPKKCAKQVITPYSKLSKNNMTAIQFNHVRLWGIICFRDLLT